MPLCSSTSSSSSLSRASLHLLLTLPCLLLSFYRLVLEADVNFLANDTMSPGPTARFTQLPESPLLTLNMITPDSWMVEAVSSPHDLDNIHLQEVRAPPEPRSFLLPGV